ncbi:MAG: hypothetical protein PHI06_12420 [Desulfobulbaceae bacterium]|nr:hypothetical protein [Desulfobulbaceae bacterium]
MDIEIFLDCSEGDPQNHALAIQKFHEWFAEGAEVKCNKLPFRSLTPLPETNRYLLDLGYADVIISLRTLHARINRLGVKAFFHFA